MSRIGQEKIKSRVIQLWVLQSQAPMGKYRMCMCAFVCEKLNLKKAYRIKETVNLRIWKTRDSEQRSSAFQIKESEQWEDRELLIRCSTRELVFRAYNYSSLSSQMLSVLHFPQISLLFSSIFYHWKGESLTPKLKGELKDYLVHVPILLIRKLRLRELHRANQSVVVLISTSTSGLPMMIWILHFLLFTPVFSLALLMPYETCLFCSRVMDFAK